MVTLENGLLERQDITSEADRLVDAAAEGRAGALFLVGEAGLGKTSVLDHACRRATRSGLAIGHGRGHPMEAALPFGLLAQALDGLGGQGMLNGEPHAASPADDRAAGFYRVLRWLAQQGKPMLLAFDDLHWADADSLALMSFLCRRPGSAPVGVIASLRPWPREALEVLAGLVSEGYGSVKQLLPLSEAAADSLLRARLRRSLPATVRRRAFDLCAGNPLLLEQVAIALDHGEDLPEAGGPGALVFRQGLLLARFAGLPPEGMRCAQAASVLGGSFLPEVAAQVAGLDEREIDLALESLGRSGLIEQRHSSEADFVHPLFRQALYDDLSGPIRARLHARAFAILHERGMDARAAEHAVSAHMVGDIGAVTVLERAGRAARQAGALATAAKLLGDAVVLAGGQVEAGLLLAQGEALLAGGSAPGAREVYDRLLAMPGITVTARLEALRMLGRALVLTGAHERAAAVFDEAASMAASNGDRVTPVEVLLDSALASWLTVGPAGALPLVTRAVALAGPPGAAAPARRPLQIRAQAAWGFIALQSGVAAAAGVIAQLTPRLADKTGPGLADVDGVWGAVNCFGHAACLVERLTDAERSFAAGRAIAERAGATEAMAVLACGHAYVLTRMGRLREAFAAINHALSFTDLVPLAESFAGVGSAHIQLYMGQLDGSAHWCERVEATATARGEWNALLFLWDVLGHRRLREGAAAQACELYSELEATIHRMGIGEPCMPPWARHAVSAYVAAGRLDDAERVLGWLGRCTEGLPCRFPRIAAATGRAQLAEAAGRHETADAEFQEAMALHEVVDLPLEHVETLLAYGAFLRRSGRSGPARRILAQAVTVAEAAGAGWLAGLAREELKVAGGRLRRRREPGALTAQEERVASLVTTGAANPEIARQLYLSVNTVETHLERIYAKLGIHSRYELIARAASGGWPGPQASRTASQASGTASQASRTASQASGTASQASRTASQASGTGSQAKQ